ncbi:protein phosphatase 2C domain-containing protein [Streptomyces sp. 8N706]|uniref:protein phosphatase 2C domain-containing protein n=1 Tax=Streptomyces sp. 8N706 TaxID=3457416 RepID=UPI003FD5DEB9
MVVDRGIPPFEPKPPCGASYRPDTICDGWSTDELTVRVASVRGYSHRYRGSPREDDVAVAVHQPTGTLVFAVADGVSSAAQSHLGATLACRTAVDNILEQLDSGAAAVDWEQTVRNAAYQLIMRITGGRKPTADEVQEAERQFATTLVAGTLVAQRHGVPRLSLVQVGDSSAWVLRGDGRVVALLESKYSAPGELVSSAVEPLPRVPKQVEARVGELPPDAVLLVGTDGFGDPLGDGTGQVAELFAGHLRTPPPARALAHLLDFSRETFDDDRTLLAVWPRHLLTEAER